VIRGLVLPHGNPILLSRPTCQFCHLYIWQDGAWADVIPEPSERPLP